MTKKPSGTIAERWTECYAKTVEGYEIHRGYHEPDTDRWFFMTPEKAKDQEAYNGRYFQAEGKIRTGFYLHVCAVAVTKYSRGGFMLCHWDDVVPNGSSKPLSRIHADLQPKGRKPPPKKGRKKPPPPKKRKSPPPRKAARRPPPKKKPHRKPPPRRG